METRFEIQQILELTGRGGVLAGTILEGAVRPGMRTQRLEFAGAPAVLEVSAVEFADNVRTGESLVALLFRERPTAQELSTAVQPGTVITLTSPMARCLILTLDAQKIVDRRSFHEAFQKLLGFPDHYGRNMNAWIDCMLFLRDPSARMTAIHLGREERLLIELKGAEDFQHRLPDLFADLAACTAFVNHQYVEAGEDPAVALVLM